MRITIVLGPFFPTPPGPAGAVERRWTGVAAQLSENGHQITLISRRFPGLSDKETVAGIQHLRYPGFGQSSQLAINLFKDLMYSIRLIWHIPPCDVVVLNSFWLPVLLSLTPRRNKPVLIYNAARFPKRQMFLYAKVDRLLAVSQAVAEAIIRQSPARAAQVRVVPNPIDTVVFQPPTGKRANDQTKTITYAGRIHPEKGLDLLIEACLLLSRRGRAIRLHMLGPATIERGGGGDDYVRRLRQAAQGLDFDLQPPVYDREHFRDVLYGSDVFCYPSLAERGESFGVAPLEAMATGLPTVVSDLQCFRDYVEDETNALIFNHRADDAAKQLADALDRVIRPSPLTDAMSRNAAETAKRFSYRAITDQYLEVFQEALDKRRKK